MLERRELSGARVGLGAWKPSMGFVRCAIIFVLVLGENLDLDSWLRVLAIEEIIGYEEWL